MLNNSMVDTAWIFWDKKFPNKSAGSPASRFAALNRHLGDQTGHALDEMQFVNFITAFVRGLGSAFGIVNKEWMF